MHDFTIVFTNILLTFSVLLNNAIEMFIDVSKNMGYLGINYGLPTLKDSFDELVEDKLIIRRVYGTCVCHGIVPVVYNKLSLRIDTYLLIGTGIGSVNYLHYYIITSVVIFDVFHIYVIEY